MSHLSDRAATGGTEPEGVAVVDELDAVAMEPTELDTTLPASGLEPPCEHSTEGVV